MLHFCLGCDPRAFGDCWVSLKGAMLAPNFACACGVTLLSVQGVFL